MERHACLPLLSRFGCAILLKMIRRYRYLDLLTIGLCADDLEPRGAKESVRKGGCGQAPRNSLFPLTYICAECSPRSTDTERRAERSGMVSCHGPARGRGADGGALPRAPCNGKASDRPRGPACNKTSRAGEIFATMVGSLSQIKGVVRGGFGFWSESMVVQPGWPSQAQTGGRAVRSIPQSFDQSKNRSPEPEPAGERIQQARVIVLKRLIGMTCVVLGLAVCGLPETSRDFGCGRGRRRNAGHAGADGGRFAFSRAAEQRVCSDHQIAPLGHACNPRWTAASRRSVSAPGDHVKSGQADDVHRPAAPAGRSRRAARHRAAEEGASTTTMPLPARAPEEAVRAGIISRDVFDQAQQAYDNSKADYESASPPAKRRKSNSLTTPSARRSMGLSEISPCMWATMFPPTTMLTTVDENKDLEAYIYVPTERASQIRIGLEVDLLDTTGKMLEKVEDRFHFAAGGQHIAGHSREGSRALCTADAAQFATGQSESSVEHGAHGSGSGPGGYPPGRSKFRLCGQAAERALHRRQTPVTLGDTVGNTYSVTSGLNAGDRVIVSSTQFLVNNMPVQPLGA